MKILKNKTLLIISNSYPTQEGSTEGVFVKSQVDELKKYFKKIIVISPQPYFPSILTKIKPLQNNFTPSNKFKNYTYDNVVVYYPKFYTLPTEYFRKRNGDYAYKATKKCIEKHKIKFDLIHAHFTWTSGYVASKLKENYKKKVILTTHGLHKTRLNTFLKNYFALKTWKNTDLILNVAEEYSTMLNELGIESQKLKFVPNIVDLKKFHPIKNSEKKLSILKDKKIILSVGNLVEKKGFEYLIKSLKLLKNKRKDFICYIIGGGPLETKLNKLIQKLDLDKNVKLLGPKPHEEIPLWMNLADVFVLNSFVESFGVVNIEALACGTPVISTINGGSEYVITSKDYGYIIDNPKNIKDLSKHIDETLNKKWNTKKMMNYTKIYESEEVINKLIKNYEAIL